MSASTQPSRPAASRRVTRLAITKAEAADALGVSVDFLEDHVMRELRVVRRGRRLLIAVAELAKWLEANSQRTLPY